jgi:hypothetical protein
MAGGAVEAECAADDVGRGSVRAEPHHAVALALERLLQRHDLAARRVAQAVRVAVRKDHGIAGFQPDRISRAVELERAAARLDNMEVRVACRKLQTPRRLRLGAGADMAANPQQRETVGQ